MPRRRRLFRLGIRQKVVLVLLTVLLTALSISGYLVMRDVEQNVLSETDRRGAETADYLARSIAYSVVGYDYHTIQLLLDQVVEAGGVVHARVLSDRGNTMAEVQHPDRANLERVEFQRPIELDGREVGHLEMELSIEPILAQLEQQKTSLIRREVAVIALIALGEFVALSWIIIAPLTRVSRALESNVDQNGVILRDIDVHSNDEIGDLAARFNQMRAQLNTANEQLRGRVESADRELREAYERLIQQQKQLESSNAELEVLTRTDPLTGLGNRRAFQEAMEQDIALFRRHGDPASLLILDLDNFKAINDTWGHDTGDRILKAFAGLLREHCRDTDTTCRMGGEEFAVFLRRCDAPGALKTAEKLRQTVAAMGVPTEDGRQQLHVTVSIGLASLSLEEGVTSSKGLCRAADQAMYASKRRGRNRVTNYTTLISEDPLSVNFQGDET
ncbi:diguanylate cyclase [Thioalkalivibrio sp. ALM2T]|uniref:diguanylate cyclase n=1 Tax=Thioalkalivibrio sp. ALM2T TaxID=1158184 RepID=UPI000477E9AA|nr:diguanylate cyclase [Thioalkalivibrio sp. ALM2T]